MLLIRCPYCEEERPELEFRGAGEAHIARPTNMAEISDGEFERFFFIRDNRKGIVFERWRHISGCGRFFNAARDTMKYAWSRAKRMSVTKSVFKTAQNKIRNRIHKNKAAEAIRRAAEFDPHTF